MQLDEPFLLLVLVLNLLDLAVSHRRFCGEENVLCVPTDMSKVSSTIGFRTATSSRVGEVTVLVCAPYATVYKLVRQLGPRPFDHRNEISSQAVFVSLIKEATLVPSAKGLAIFRDPYLWSGFCKNEFSKVSRHR